MKIPLLNLWISRQAPMSLTLNNPTVKIGTPRRNKDGDLEIDMEAQGRPEGAVGVLFDNEGQYIVPRKKAGEVFALLTELYMTARKQGGLPKKQRVHPSRIVEPVHQEIKKLYGIVAAKKDAQQ